MSRDPEVITSPWLALLILWAALMVACVAAWLAERFLLRDDEGDR